MRFVRPMPNAILALCLALLYTSGCPSIQAADIELRVGSPNLDTNTGYVEFDVNLINATGVDVILGSFNLNLEITPLTPRAIQFDSTSQPDMFTEPLYSSYVLYNDSDGATQAAPYLPWGVFSVNGIDDQYLFTDSTLTGSPGVTISNGTTRLLSRVRVVTGTALAGDIFTIAIQTGQTGTLLSDESFNAIPFTTTDGTVRVVVPEPSAYGLGAFAAGVMACFVRRRRIRGV